MLELCLVDVGAVWVLVVGSYIGLECCACRPFPSAVPLRGESVGGTADIAAAAAAAAVDSRTIAVKAASRTSAANSELECFESSFECWRQGMGSSVVVDPADYHYRSMQLGIAVAAVSVYRKVVETSQSVVEYMD